MVSESKPHCEDNDEYNVHQRPYFILINYTLILYKSKRIHQNMTTIILTQIQHVRDIMR